MSPSVALSRAPLRGRRGSFACAGAAPAAARCLRRLRRGHPPHAVLHARQIEHGLGGILLANTRGEKDGGEGGGGCRQSDRDARHQKAAQTKNAVDTIDQSKPMDLHQSSRAVCISLGVPTRQRQRWGLARKAGDHVLESSARFTPGAPTTPKRPRHFSARPSNGAIAGAIPEEPPDAQPPRPRGGQRCSHAVIAISLRPDDDLWSPVPMTEDVQRGAQCDTEQDPCPQNREAPCSRHNL